MNDAAACGHPLNISRCQNTLVSDRILVAHQAVKNESHGLEAPVRVIWEAGDIGVRIIGVHAVEHQKGVNHI